MLRYSCLLVAFWVVVTSCAGDHVNGVDEGSFNVTSHCSFAEQETGVTSVKVTTVVNRRNVSLGDVKPFGIPQNQVYVFGTGIIEARDEVTKCSAALLGRNSKDLIFFCHHSGVTEENCLVILSRASRG